MSLFKIFFLCEDLVSLERAVALKEKLAGNCLGHVDIEADFCEYPRLCHPRLRETATQQLQDADMIIVSARGTNALPAFVQNWLDQAGALCPEKIICGEFVEKTSPDKTNVFHRCLEKWALQKGAFFFSNLYPESLHQPLAPALA